MLLSSLVLGAALSVGQCPASDAVHTAGRIVAAPFHVAGRIATAPFRAFRHRAAYAGQCVSCPTVQYVAAPVVYYAPAPVYHATAPVFAPSPCAGGVCPAR